MFRTLGMRCCVAVLCRLYTATGEGAGNLCKVVVERQFAVTDDTYDSNIGQESIQTYLCRLQSATMRWPIVDGDVGFRTHAGSNARSIAQPLGCAGPSGEHEEPVRPHPIRKRLGVHSGAAFTAERRSQWSGVHSGAAFRMGLASTLTAVFTEIARFLYAPAVCPGRWVSFEVASNEDKNLIMPDARNSRYNLHYLPDPVN